MSQNFNEYKKYALMNLIQEYVMQTGELPDTEKLKSLGVSARDLIEYLKIYPRGCKSLSQNTSEYLKQAKIKLPELRVINMSGCLLTKEVIKELNKTKIEKVFFDATYFFNMFNFNLDELIKMSNKKIQFKNSEWFDYYYGLQNALSGDNDGKYDYFSNEVNRKIKELLKNGFNAQSGLDGLLNSYISGSRYGFQDFPPQDTEKHHFKTLVKIFLNNGAKLRLGILVPSLDYFNLTNMNNKPELIEDLSDKINMQWLILKTFYEIDKSLIIPNIYNYLPKNWKDVEGIYWQDNPNPETQTLSELIYEDFKFFSGNIL
jgi:hypothetical protein